MSHPLVSLTSSAPLLLLFCPEELSCPKFSPKLCPELLLFNLWKIRRRPLGFVAIGCRLLDCLQIYCFLTACYHHQREEMNKKAKMNEIKILTEMNKMNRPAATRALTTWSPLSHLHWRTLCKAARPAWAIMTKITRQKDSIYTRN